MRDVIMWNVMSLDGMFEGATKWDLWFHETVWGPELERFSIEQLDSGEVLLFGRVTYEGMAAHWTKATGDVAERMNAIDKIVFSRSLEHADWNNTRIARDAVEEVRRLKQQPGSNILVFGSANLCQSLIDADLVDEYRLCIAPVFVGDGSPLFTGAGKKTLKLVETRALETGGVLVFYRRP